MYTTHTAEDFYQPAADPSLESRLSWLLRENELAANQGRGLRAARREEERLMMLRPVTPQQAYARFGLLLGTFPPAAIFLKISGGWLSHAESGLVFLLLSMNIFCALAGLYFGSRLSRMAAGAEDSHWLMTLAGAPCLGFLWGAATGAVGGLPAFGVGAIFGAIYAIPVGALAFGLFVPLHRLLARGGMIDARHLWPLACGVVAVVTALILGL
jgi:hypothetical protein